MKFDLIIGNPPYDRSLHLKILKKAMEYCDFDSGGEIVWLHPARWMASIDDKKKYSWLDNKIKSFDVIQGSEMNDIFQIGLFSCGLITRISKNGKSPSDFNPVMFRGAFKGGDSKIHPRIENWDLALSVFNKILSNPGFTPICNFEKEYDLTAKNGKYYCQHNLLVGNGGFQPKHIYNNGVSLMNSRTVFENRGAMNKTVKLLINALEFNTKNEAENYRLSQFTNFILFMDAISRVDVHVHPDKIPFMIDYSKPWTDERYFEYFDLTEDERKLVKDTMITRGGKKQ